VTEPIRVLRLIARLNMGGPALHVSYLTNGLAERGYETTLAAGKLARGEGSMSFVADELGVRVESIPQLHREISPLYDPLTVTDCNVMLGKLPPDFFPRGFGPHAEQPPERRATVFGGRDPPVEIDAESDDRELLCGRHPERHEVVAHLGADGDEARRTPGQGPLECAEEGGRRWVEVAAQHVAVEGVDDDRRSRAAGEARCQAPDRAGLRRVRVQDVRPHVLDQAHDAGDGERVVER